MRIISGLATALLLAASIGIQSASAVAAMPEWAKATILDACSQLANQEKKTLCLAVVTVDAPGEKELMAAMNACDLYKNPDREIRCINALMPVAIAYEAARTAGRQSPVPEKPKSTTSNATEEIKFRDIPLDTPGQQSALRDLCQRTDPGRCDFDGPRRSFWTSFGNMAKAWVTVILSSNGELLEVEAKGKREEMLVLANRLESKYGKPLIQETRLQNKIGNTFDKQTFRWEDDRGHTIVVESRLEKVDEGRFVISSRLAKAFSKSLDDAVRSNEKSGL